MKGRSWRSAGVGLGYGGRDLGGETPGRGGGDAQGEENAGGRRSRWWREERGNEKGRPTEKRGGEEKLGERRNGEGRPPEEGSRRSGLGDREEGGAAGKGEDAAAQHKPGQGRRRRRRLYLRARSAREIGPPGPRPAAPRGPLARPRPRCAAQASAAVNISRPTAPVRATARMRVRPSLALKGATALLVGPGAVPADDFQTDREERERRKACHALCEDVGEEVGQRTAAGEDYHSLAPPSRDPAGKG